MEGTLPRRKLAYDSPSERKIEILSIASPCRGPAFFTPSGASISGEENLQQFFLGVRRYLHL